MALNTLQVTLGAGATRVNATTIRVRQLTVQNNASNPAAVCRVGDSNVSATRGYSLSPATTSYSGSATFGGQDSYNLDLKDVWLFGTAAQVIDILWID